VQRRLDVAPRLFGIHLARYRVRLVRQHAAETMRGRPATERACGRMMYVVDQEGIEIRGRPDRAPRIPRAYEGTFHHLGN
jgi:hypothetical protein